MIQFNLLPDVKIAYIKAQRQKRIVMSVSMVASIAAVAVFVLLFSFVHVVQKKSMNDLTSDIKTQSEDLTGTRDLNKILTVQNQLGALEALHSQKVASARLYPYLEQVTPANIGISQLEIDFTANTMKITGGAPSLAAVNTYADSLKFTRFKTKSSSEQNHAFKGVVLSSFSVSDTTGPVYTFDLSFDPILFSQDEEVELVVPQMVTTRSSTERPGSVFQESGGGQ